MLVRAIEQGEVRPVGAKSATRVDVRLVAATNKDLERAISEGEFLPDLHDRLSEVVLEVPPFARGARTSRSSSSTLSRSIAAGTALGFAA